MPDRPIRVLELRSVCGSGGGPEKTILAGTAGTDATRIAITVCYLKNRKDAEFNIGRRAAQLGLDYVEIAENYSLDPTIWFQLRRLVRTRRIDIVHAHEYKTDLLACALASVEGVTAMATVHGWNGRTLKERLVYYPADRRVLRRFAHVVAVSRKICQDLERSGIDPRRVSTIPNGIDVTRFVRDPARCATVRKQIGVPQEAVVIGGVGRLEKEKRFDLLLDLVATVRRTNPAIHLLLAGSGSEESKLRQHTTALGIELACTFAGQVDDMVGLYHAIDLFIQTSDTEGTPNAVLEAMAMQVPIIATDVGGTSDLITHNTHGLLVPRRDVQALGHAIRNTLEDPSSTAARVKAARSRTENELSFKARMHAVERIYADLFASRPTSTGSLTAVA